MLAVLSLLFFFISATTFSTLGRVLYAMALELKWSQSVIGTCYAILGLSCGLSSPLPALLLRRFGSCAVLTGGALVLAAGFLAAALSHALPVFMAATALLGTGFTLTANIPGVYLLAGWFPRNTARIMGAYFMAGALGAVAGPPLINALVEAAGWRLHWVLMALIAAVLAVLCALIVRDTSCMGIRPAEAPAAQTPGTPPHSPPDTPDSLLSWEPRAALLTGQFLGLALLMLLVQTTLTTVHGLLVGHLAHLGATAAFGSIVMSLLGAADAGAKGAGGSLCARLGAQRVMVAGVLVMGLSLGLLPFAGAAPVACAFAVVLGAAGGVTWLALHLLLLQYFGRAVAAQMVSAATLITTAAAAGPVAAGLTADLTGSFMPFFYCAGAILLIATLPAALLRPPRAAPSAMAVRPQERFSEAQAPR